MPSYDFDLSHFKIAQMYYYCFIIFIVFNFYFYNITNFHMSFYYSYVATYLKSTIEIIIYSII